MSSVEREERQQIQEREGERDERKDAGVLAEADLERLARGLDDSDRTCDLVRPLPGDDPPQRGADRLRHEPRAVGGQPDRLEEAVALIAHVEREAEAVEAVTLNGARLELELPGTPLYGELDLLSPAGTDPLRNLLRLDRPAVDGGD